MTTLPHPNRSARTRFFPGSRTSLPMKVTFVQAVWAKSGPIIALPKSNVRATPPTNVKPACAICGLQPLAQEFHHSDDRAALIKPQPNERPITISDERAEVLANVKVLSNR